MRDQNFKSMIPQLAANEIYKTDFISGYNVAEHNIKTYGFVDTLEQFNKNYPVGMSGYFRTLSDYFYAKGQCACLLDHI